MTEFLRLLMEQHGRPSDDERPNPVERMETFESMRKRLDAEGEAFCESSWSHLMPTVGRGLIDLGFAITEGRPAFPGLWFGLDDIAKRFPKLIRKIAVYSFAYFCESLKILKEEPLIEDIDTNDENDWLLTVHQAFFSLWRFEYMLLALQDLEVTFTFDEELFASAKVELAKLEVIAEALRVKRSEMPIDEEAEWREEQAAAKLLQELHPMNPRLEDPDGGWITPTRVPIDDPDNENPE